VKLAVGRKKEKVYKRKFCTFIQKNSLILYKKYDTVIPLNKLLCPWTIFCVLLSLKGYASNYVFSNGDFFK